MIFATTFAGYNIELLIAAEKMTSGSERRGVGIMIAISSRRNRHGGGGCEKRRGERRRRRRAERRQTGRLGCRL